MSFGLQIEHLRLQWLKNFYVSCVDEDEMRSLVDYFAAKSEYNMPFDLKLPRNFSRPRRDKEATVAERKTIPFAKKMKVLGDTIAARLEKTRSNETSVPVLRNISYLAELFKLDEIDQQLLLFFSDPRLTRFADLHVGMAGASVSSSSFIARCLGTTEATIEEKLRPSGRLMASGLISSNLVSANKGVVDGNIYDDELMRYQFNPYLKLFIYDEVTDETEFRSMLLGERLDDAPDLPDYDSWNYWDQSKDFEAELLGAFEDNNERGRNTPLVGPTGSGKTSIVAAWGRRHNIAVYRVGTHKRLMSGRRQEMTRADYYAAFHLQQAVVGALGLRVVSIADEFDDFLSTGAKDPTARASRSKLGMNVDIENNTRAVTVFVSNTTADIDMAMIRRIGAACYYLGAPPPEQRAQMLKRFSKEFGTAISYEKALLLGREFSFATPGIIKTIARRVGSWQRIGRKKLWPKEKFNLYNAYRRSFEKAQRVTGHGATAPVERDPPKEFDLGFLEPAPGTNLGILVQPIITALSGDSPKKPRILIVGPEGSGKGALARFLVSQADGYAVPTLWSDIPADAYSAVCDSLVTDALTQKGCLIVESTNGLFKDRKSPLAADPLLAALRGHSHGSIICHDDAVRPSIGPQDFDVVLELTTLSEARKRTVWGAMFKGLPFPDDQLSGYKINIGDMVQLRAQLDMFPALRAAPKGIATLLKNNLASRQGCIGYGS